MDETATQRARRLALEQRCAILGKQIAGKMDAETAFVLIFADFGEGGHMAHLSNADRVTMVKMLYEMAEKLESS